MFETAYEKLNLTEADKSRIVMVGNNLKKDIAGANRQGLISVWLDWSPRYFHTVEEPDWQPDYTVKTPAELIPLLHALEEKLEKEVDRVVKKLANQGFVAKAPSNVIEEEKAKEEKYKAMLAQVEERLAQMKK